MRIEVSTFPTEKLINTFPTEKLVDRYKTKIFNELAKSRRMYIINSVDWLLWQQMATFQYLW